jgi:L-histidine N-alpha-methyltransferase
MPRLSVEVLISPAARDAAMRDDVRSGLTATPKSIPPVWFYDETGSQLFDRITRLPEYYLTRAERAILADQAGAIAERAGPAALVEIGSGTSEKTRLLLDAMAGAGSLRGITLLDISEEILRQAATELCARYDVDVHAVVGDFRFDLAKLASSGTQLWAFLGSTIGNFGPAERHTLLSDFCTAMGPSDHLLLGTDLVKSPTRLVSAYDDREGITAAFNLNVLSVLNESLNADFDPWRYQHVARWNAADSWVEMRLRSVGSQSVTLAGLDMKVGLDDREEILTEISAKFDPAAVARELGGAGLVQGASWTDPAGDFMLSLAGPDRM